MGLWALVLPQAAAAIDEAPVRPQAGLLWHQSGLPAVFPLQVKSDAGRDYLLTLTDVETGDAVLGAYVRGGAFFRVLVPPGTFTLRFAYGDRWMGNERGFGTGPDSGAFELDRPLTFEIGGYGTKSGHLLDLRAPNGAALVTGKPIGICQSRRILPEVILRWPDGDGVDFPMAARPSDCLPGPLTCWRPEITSRYCD